MGRTCCSLFLSALLLHLLYKGFQPNQYRHKTRMKYMTSLSCIEVIERFGKEAEGDFQYIVSAI